MFYVGFPCAECNPSSSIQGIESGVQQSCEVSEVDFLFSTGLDDARKENMGQMKIIQHI